MARDLALRVEDVEQNTGRLVVREHDLLAWLDRDRAGAARSGGGAAARAAAEGTAAEGTARRAAAEGTEGAAASFPRRRRAARRRSRARDVPGLKGALEEWLRENDSTAAAP